MVKKTIGLPVLLPPSVGLPLSLTGNCPFPFFSFFYPRLDVRTHGLFLLSIRCSFLAARDPSLPPPPPPLSRTGAAKRAHENPFPPPPDPCSSLQCESGAASPLPPLGFLPPLPSRVCLERPAKFSSFPVTHAQDADSTRRLRCVFVIPFFPSQARPVSSKQHDFLLFFPPFFLPGFGVIKTVTQTLPFPLFFCEIAGNGEGECCFSLQLSGAFPFVFLFFLPAETGDVIRRSFFFSLGVCMDLQQIVPPQPLSLFSPSFVLAGGPVHPHAWPGVSSRPHRLLSAPTRAVPGPFHPLPPPSAIYYNSTPAICFFPLPPLRGGFYGIFFPHFFFFPPSKTRTPHFSTPQFFSPDRFDQLPLTFWIFFSPPWFVTGNGHKCAPLCLQKKGSL